MDYGADNLTPQPDVRSCGEACVCVEVFECSWAERARPTADEAACIPYGRGGGGGVRRADKGLRASDDERVYTQERGRGESDGARYMEHNMTCMRRHVQPA